MPWQGATKDENHPLRLLYPLQHGAGNILTTNMHDPYVALDTPGVKRVLRPATGEGGVGVIFIFRCAPKGHDRYQLEYDLENPG